MEFLSGDGFAAGVNFRTCLYIAGILGLAALVARSGLPLLTVLMAQVIGYGAPVLPYQASPVVVATGMGGVPARDGARLCLAMAAITYILLVPLDYLWLVLLRVVD